jgi:uncharacterized oxidoreductase
MLLTDNTVLVTGGGSGIGRGLAVALHRAGNAVVVAGRRIDALREVCEAHPGIDYVHLDQTDPDSLRHVAHVMAQEHPDLNVVINNAGTVAFEDVTDADAGTVASIVSTNLLGPIRLTSLLLPTLLAQPHAAIINVTSGLAFVPLAVSPTYSATKAGLHSYTESLRIQLRDTKVEVLEIVPPRVLTDAPGPIDGNTMDLDAFIAETMALLDTGGQDGEILVESVRPLRFAERNGDYREWLQTINASGPTTR